MGCHLKSEQLKFEVLFSSKFAQTERTLANRDPGLFVLETISNCIFSTWALFSFFGMFKIFSQISNFVVRKQNEFKNVKVTLSITCSISIIGWVIAYNHVFWDANSLGTSWYVASAVEASILGITFIFILFRVWRKIVEETKKKSADNLPRGKDIQLAIRKISFFLIFISITLPILTIFYTFYFAIDWFHNRQW